MTEHSAPDDGEGRPRPVSPKEFAGRLGETFWTVSPPIENMRFDGDEAVEPWRAVLFIHTNAGGSTASLAPPQAGEPGYSDDEGRRALAIHRGRSVVFETREEAENEYLFALGDEVERLIRKSKAVLHEIEERMVLRQPMPKFLSRLPEDCGISKSPHYPPLANFARAVGAVLEEYPQLEPVSTYKRLFEFAPIDNLPEDLTYEAWAAATRRAVRRDAAVLAMIPDTGVRSVEGPQECYDDSSMAAACGVTRHHIVVARNAGRLPEPTGRTADGDPLYDEAGLRVAQELFRAPDETAAA